MLLKRRFNCAQLCKLETRSCPTDPNMLNMPPLFCSDSPVASGDLHLIASEGQRRLRSSSVVACRHNRLWKREVKVDSFTSWKTVFPFAVRRKSRERDRKSGRRQRWRQEELITPSAGSHPGSNHTQGHADISSQVTITT